jgi:hypothetical protein
MVGMVVEVEADDSLEIGGARHFHPERLCDWSFDYYSILLLLLLFCLVTTVIDN